MTINIDEISVANSTFGGLYDRINEVIINLNDVPNLGANANNVGLLEITGNTEISDTLFVDTITTEGVGVTSIDVEAEMIIDDELSISGVAGNGSTLSIADAADSPMWTLYSPSGYANLDFTDVSTGNFLRIDGTSNELTGSGILIDEDILPSIFSRNFTYSNISITGGAIDGTPIGANTASTGNFSSVTTVDFDISGTFSIDSTEVTSTATEINILDGITSTTTELNYTDGVTSPIQTQLNNKQPLNSILNGLSSIVPSSGDIIVSSGSNSFSTGYSIIDEDDMSSDSATALPVQQSIKAYIDSYAWHKVDTLLLADASRGTIETSDFEEGFEYRLNFNQLGFQGDGNDRTVKLHVFKGNADAWIAETTSITNDTDDGSPYLRGELELTECTNIKIFHYFQSRAALHRTPLGLDEVSASSNVLRPEVRMASADWVKKVRIGVEQWIILNGTIDVYRRRIR